MVWYEEGRKVLLDHFKVAISLQSFTTLKTKHLKDPVLRPFIYSEDTLLASQHHSFTRPSPYPRK